MRQQVKSSSRRFLAPQVKIGKSKVIIYTPDGDERIDIDVEGGLSEGVVLPPAGTTLRNVSVSVNGPGDKLYGMFPGSGAHIVCFDGFSTAGNDKPSPRMMPGGPRTAADGRKWHADDKLVFTALLRVMRGDFEGMIIPWTLDYIFERDVTGMVMVRGSKRAQERLIHFLELCGMDTANTEIPWSDNILPDLEMILSEFDDQVFQVSMKNGWVDEASELPAGVLLGKTAKRKPVVEEEDDFEDDEEEEEVPAPKASKRKPVVEDEDDDEVEDLVPPKKQVVDRRAVRKPVEDEPFEDEDVKPARHVRRSKSDVF